MSATSNSFKIVLKNCNPLSHTPQWPRISNIFNDVANIADDCFNFLDSPVRRLCAKDSHIPYHPNFEDDVLPSENKVYDELVKLLNF